MPRPFFFPFRNKSADLMKLVKYGGHHCVLIAWSEFRMKSSAGNLKQVTAPENVSWVWEDDNFNFAQFVSRVSSDPND